MGANDNSSASSAFPAFISLPISEKGQSAKMVNYKGWGSIRVRVDVATVQWAQLSMPRYVVRFVKSAPGSVKSLKNS